MAGLLFASGGFASAGPRRTLGVIITALGLVPGVLVTARQASAQCAPSYYAWTPPTTTTGIGAASAPAIDTSFNPQGHSYSYFAQGTTLFAVRNVADGAGQAGSVKWTWQATPPTLQNVPAPVPLSAPGAGEFIFVTGQDGFLYKLTADTGTQVGSVDTRRMVSPGVFVCPADQITATPAVQLYSFSDSAFRSDVDAVAGHAQDDVIFVVTHNQCGDTTHNRVVAYWARDLTVKWVFNANSSNASGSPSRVDYASEGCTVDYGTNTLFCGTTLVDVPTTQNSLWALDTRTGGLKWSGNAGPIQNRPMLANDRLYVATFRGVVMAYDPAGDSLGGARPLWAAPVQMPAAVVRNLWPEFRSGPFQGSLLVLDTAGTLRAIRDEGTSGTILWSITAETGVRFTSAPVVVPAGTKAYIGRSDGQVQQIDLASGAGEGTAVVNPGARLSDPALDVEMPGSLDRLVVVADGVGGGPGNVTRLVLPLCAAPRPPGAIGCASDADCTNPATNPFYNPCVPMRCDLSTFTCYRSAPFPYHVPDGTACDDGQPCTCDSSHADAGGSCVSTSPSCNDGHGTVCNDVCVDGVCFGSFHAICPCIAPGDVACAPGATCCGQSSGGCVHPLDDAQHCGGCSTDCSPGTCTRGVCSESVCPAPTESQLQGAGVLGADAITFERTNANVCSAYVSTYRTSGTSALVKIAPGGAVTSYTTADPTPLHGVAVPPSGDQVFGAFVNSGGSFTPGLALKPPGSGTTFGNVLPSASTSGTAPFSDSRFNEGPVGPAFDRITYDGSDASRHAYLANWTVNGDLVGVSYSATWQATPVTGPSFSNPSGARVTAIAFERRSDTSTMPATRHRALYVAHGTSLSTLDLDVATQTDVDLGASCAPDPARGTAAVAGILSIAVHPVYGDVYVLVKDVNDTRYMIAVDPHDQSCRHLLDVQTDGHTTQSSVPNHFGTTDGRIAITPALELLRIVPRIDLTPESVATYTVTPPRLVCTPTTPDGTPCDDGNACTQLDTCQAGTCVGANPVTCTPSDQCHDAGTCDPATGTCSNPPKPDGVACDDGNVCTAGDACRGGVCAGSGENGGCIPPDKPTGKCEDTVVKNAAKLASALAHCHIKAADAALRGVGFDAGACTSTARGKYDGAIARLLAGGTCPPCLGASAPGIRQLLEATVGEAAGRAYCTGTAPLP